MPMTVTVTSALSRAEVEATDGLTLGLNPRVDTDTEAHMATVLGELIDEVQAVDGLDLSSLRHVLATQDFPDDVRRWQRVLSRPEVVTVTDAAMAVGKALSWRREGTGQAASIVVMPSDYLQGVAHGIPLARGILCHELAHIHEYSQDMRGADSEHPDARDLDAVIRFIAQSAASECFAERIASRHYSEADLVGFVENTDTIKSYLVAFEQEKDAYRSHADLLHLWQHAILTVGRSADMIGRTVGEFHQDRHRHLFDGFARGPGQSAWATVAKQVQDELTLSRPYPTKPSSVSSGVILSMFQALGVYPRLQAGGQLYVDVP